MCTFLIESIILQTPLKVIFLTFGDWGKQKLVQGQGEVEGPTRCHHRKWPGWVCNAWWDSVVISLPTLSPEGGVTREGRGARISRDSEDETEDEWVYSTKRSPARVAREILVPVIKPEIQAMNLARIWATSFWDKLSALPTLSFPL